MAQTPALRYQSTGEAIDYTPVAAVTAGDVVVLGTVPLIATSNIAAGVLGSLATSGVFKVPKTSDVIAEFAPVYWDVDGSPVTGTASSGAADGNSASGYLMGLATEAALTGDSYVKVWMGKQPAGAGTSTAVSTVAATGNSQGTAAAVPLGWTLVSAADGTKGVILPAAAEGKVVTIKNGANAVLKVYPATGDAINAIAADGAISMAALTSATFTAYDATTWYTTPSVPS